MQESCFAIFQWISPNASSFIFHIRQQENSVVHNLNKKIEADEMWVYTDVIEFFKKQNVYNEFRCVMGWRSIKAT